MKNKVEVMRLQQVQRQNICGGKKVLSEEKTHMWKMGMDILNLGLGGAYDVRESRANGVGSSVKKSHTVKEVPFINNESKK